MYQQFAEVYDEFMQDVPYSQWADYIEALWRHHGLQPHLVLDLACGTGSLTVELAKRGYDMIGADQSEDMLYQAREKAEEEEQEILFLEQDMREFELYGTVDSIVCTCDSLNYLLEDEDVQQVFKLADNYLDPGG
ncbi:MAG: class I SAM-dependent methyltransferase, partial [Firmicutes bacterium]|nr:class I SAM-dependent methyltransferase [Bacillota bacterium]